MEVRESGWHKMTGDRRRKRSRLISSSALALILLAGAAPIATDIGMVDLVGVAHAESCCFTADTLVLMADGGAKLISAIEPGDAVMGYRGRINRVIGVERVPLGQRRLHAINGQKAFFTAEHPFLTSQGWRSVSPAATIRETHTICVTELSLGDRLVCVGLVAPGIGTLAVEPSLDFHLTPLVNLSTDEAPADTVVFNLFLDGDHTYVANGFVVHNKGGEGGDGGGDGGDSGEGGESGDSGDSGDSGEGGESGDDGEGGESGDSGEGGESGSEGEGGESGESGSGSGEDARFEGNATPAGADLTAEEERDLISRGWK